MARLNELVRKTSCHFSLVYINIGVITDNVTDIKQYVQSTWRFLKPYVISVNVLLIEGMWQMVKGRALPLPSPPVLVDYCWLACTEV